MTPGFFVRKILLTASRLTKTPGISRGLLGPSASVRDFTAVKCPSSSWVELFACAQTKAIW